MTRPTASTAENRAIIQGALPAVRLEIALLEGVAALRRLEARHALLRDPAYARLFAERARGLESDMAILGPLLSSSGEWQALADASERLRQYRARVESVPADKVGTEPAALLEPTYRLEPQAIERLRAAERHLLEGGIETDSADQLHERGVRFHETLVEASVQVAFVSGGRARPIPKPLRAAMQADRAQVGGRAGTNAP